ncbi:MAG: methyltransferase domain-containing protein [Acidobacteria bacterium]|nr:MAG: methyltransferase domain-containing protein [Acidobacteriota bacterium]
MDAASDLLRLLGDETRLRLLRLLAQESLNVSELTAILGVAQSGVSRHLGLLKDAGLVREQRTGTFSWYRLDDSLVDANGPHAGLWAWLTAKFGTPTAATKADDVRLAEVRRVRREEFRDHGGDGQENKQLVPGRSWAAWSRALGLLLPPLEVADLGCGEGYLTIEAARWAKRVIAVDRSADVLARAKDLARRRGVKNITWKRGDLQKSPIDAASVDLVLLSQALHHADEPRAALTEAHRILRPGGRVLLLDLRAHKEAWVTSTLGDRWLGFDEKSLEKLLSDTGFTSAVVRVGASRAGDPFAVLIAAGTKRAPKETKGR